VATASVLNAFAADGFHYIGHINLVKHSNVAAAAAPAQESAAAPQGLHALRYTPEGHVYLAT
jgi:hypothetical protein